MTIVCVRFAYSYTYHHNYYATVPLGQSVEITNKALRLQFNESGHLSSWTDLSSSVTHPLQHSYLQEAERENLNEENVCDGTNVYTFVPDDGSTVLTPKVNCEHTISHSMTI